jgi:hypothetical protein
MSDFLSFGFGLLIMWAAYTFWAIPRWEKHFRHRREWPRLRDAWRKRK